MATPIYHEKIRSTRTTLLFLILVLAFCALSAWRFSAVGLRFTPCLFAFLGLTFFFYVINYRVLKITITDRELRLKFGLIHWQIDVENIEFSAQYDPPFWIKYGGAGVHFAAVDGKYTAFYNFLEYPRILIRFHQKQGLVRALVFTTLQPDQLLEILEKRSTAK